MAIVLTDVQQVSLSVVPLDAAGNPAVVENVVWSSSDPLLLTVEASLDGLSAVAKTVGPLGIVQISVIADAHIGEGEVVLTGLLDVEVIAGEAVTLGIAAGVPEPRL